jgi:hypothetical protein
LKLKYLITQKHKIMKKVKIALLMVVAVVFLLPSCKKGENDPSISFYSRDNRLCSDWKLTKITGTRTFVEWGTNDNITETTGFDGSLYTFTTNSTVDADYTATGAFEMTIDKSGIVTWTENYTPNGGSADVRSGTNYWYWVNTDKDKEFVYIGAGSNFYVGQCYIDRLATKELVLKYSYTSVDNGESSTSDFTYTFEQQ